MRIFVPLCRWQPHTFRQVCLLLIALYALAANMSVGFEPPSTDVNITNRDAHKNTIVNDGEKYNWAPTHDDNTRTSTIGMGNKMNNIGTESELLQF